MTVDVTNLSFTQQGLLALLHEITGLIVGWGIVDSTTVGIWTTVAVTAVNLGFLVAGAVHRHADAHVAAAHIQAAAVAVKPAAKPAAVKSSSSTKAAAAK